MKRLILFICLIILVCGCETTKTITETENTSTTKEVTRREPYPIMRTYENKNGYIDFTDSSSSIELTRIYYNNYDKTTGVGTEDSLNLRVPAGNTGNIVTIQVRGKQYKWKCYDNNAHSVAFYMKNDTEYPDLRYLGITEDVLSSDNEYDFVRVFVNNVLYEMYYISDFALTE